METPYTVDFEAEQVRSLLQELFQKDEDERWPICRIGITENYPGGYTAMVNDKKWSEVYEKYNVMLERVAEGKLQEGLLGVGLPAYKAPVRCSAGYAGEAGMSIPPFPVCCESLR